MSSDYSIDDILNFLSTPKTRAEISEKFNLSNTQSYLRLKWLKKAGYIRMIRFSKEGKTNKEYVYVRIR